MRTVERLDTGGVRTAQFKDLPKKGWRRLAEGEALQNGDVVAVGGYHVGIVTDAENRVYTSARPTGAVTEAIPTDRGEVRYYRATRVQ